MQQLRSRGFALPTVLIASVVLLTVLAVSVTATAAVRTSLKNQYYTQLAQVAGEAGVAYAKACLAQNDNEPQWSDAKPLKPSTDCEGNEILTPQVRALIVAGGGGGGSRHGGGGGGGGVIYNTGVSISATNYSVVVGAGGSGTASGASGNANSSTNGSNSSALGLTAIGGGAGKGSTTGAAGGSGGGGGANAAAGAGTAGQGFAGGAGLYSTYYMGGGGGGAGGAGTASSYPSNIEPPGGPGISNSISGNPVTYGAGGKGGSYNINTVAVAGEQNTGNGGGGAGGETNGGAAGGSGVVIIAYPNTGAIVATGGNETYVTGSYKVHKFTGNGTFSVSSVADSSCPGDPRCYVAENGNVRSSFSVGMPTLDDDGKALTLPNSGFVEITRSSDGSVWRTYTQPTVQAAVVPDLCSGQAASTLGWGNAYIVTDNISTDGIYDSNPIAISSSNEVYPGPHYLRKDFSVVDSGSYVLTSVAGATHEVYVDGDRVVSPTTGKATRNIQLGVGCHTIEARMYNGSNVPSGSELRLSIREEGASSSVVKTDSTWRASAGNLVGYGHPDYYMIPAGWGVVRDIHAAPAYTGTWASQSGDGFARFVASTHSLSGANYPGAQYLLLRDSRTITVSSPTEVDVTSLCDDQCNVYLDGELIQFNVWANVSTATVTLSEGTHQFSAWLYNGGVGASGFALTVKQKSNNAILTRTDNRWLASSSWQASPPSYLSYSKSYVPVPAEMNLPALAQVLVVAGGGGGGRNGGGGGGGGGALFDDSYALSVGSTSVVIGSGGVGTGSNSSPGTNGSNSSFGSLVAIGGGGGASRDGGVGGQAGGSGGGGGGATGSPRHIGGAGTAGQGSSGGNGTTPDPGCGAAGGGGGGAGGYGMGASASAGANGGAGFISYISGSRVVYGSGGAGGPTCPGGYGTADQNAGAGNGVPGTANTGGGGSGTYNSANAGGGTGVVIIAYPTGSVTATGGTVTTANGMTIHRFTSSGTFTVTSIN